MKVQVPSVQLPALVKAKQAALLDSEPSESPPEQLPFDQEPESLASQAASSVVLTSVFVKVIAQVPFVQTPLGASQFCAFVRLGAPVQVPVASGVQTNFARQVGLVTGVGSG